MLCCFPSDQSRHNYLLNKYFYYFVSSRINISEVHRIYQILEEEDNIHFMTLIEAATPKNETKISKTENKTEESVEESSEVTTEDVAESKIDQNQVLIKTETRTGYVNIDGTERDKGKNETSLSDIVKERITSYYDSTNLSANTEEGKTGDETDTKTNDNANVEVDDIIVAESHQESEPLQPPSATRAKEAYKLLPKVIQDFLSSDWKSKPKCEPQGMLERIRKENKYPDHIDVDAFEYLMTPAPSFLQRICLAGEFLNKKHMET